MNKTFLYSISTLLLIACGGSKQTTDYSFLYEDEDSVTVENDSLVFIDSTAEDTPFVLLYQDHNYSDSIQTVQLHPLRQESAFPLLNLQKEDSLLLSFDELNTGPKDYYYTLIHCNADWTPSDLLENEYLEGFYEEPITDYEASFNTLQAYTHYQAIVPSENMRPTLSGNYLLLVYEEGKREQPTLSRRLMIVDEQIRIEANIKRATLLDQRNYQHEIDFTVFHPNHEINDPFSNVQILITQNDRWDNAISGLQPVFVKTDELVYDYEEGNLFDGGNEYRFFDSKSIRYLSERIARINTEGDSIQLFLRKDEKRSFQRYSNLWQDINGKRFIRSQEGRDDYIEADYTLVHFSLPYSHEITHGDLYVFGQLSDYGFPSSHKMQYNSEAQAYEAAIYLKQGYYNYEYVLLKDEGESLSRFIEGTHYQTMNDYCIYIYHRPSGEQYDQLIGVKKLKSEGQL